MTGRKKERKGRQKDERGGVDVVAIGEHLVTAAAVSGSPVAETAVTMAAVVGG